MTSSRDCPKIWWLYSEKKFILISLAQGSVFSLLLSDVLFFWLFEALKSFGTPFFTLSILKSFEEDTTLLSHNPSNIQKLRDEFQCWEYDRIIYLTPYKGVWISFDSAQKPSTNKDQVWRKFFHQRSTITHGWLPQARRYAAGRPTQETVVDSKPKHPHTWN